MTCLTPLCSPLPAFHQTLPLIFDGQQVRMFLLAAVSDQETRQFNQSERECMIGFPRCLKDLILIRFKFATILLQRSSGMHSEKKKSFEKNK